MLEGALERLVGLHQAMISVPPPSLVARGIRRQRGSESKSARNRVFESYEYIVGMFASFPNVTCLNSFRVRWSAIPYRTNRTMTFALSTIKIREKREKE